MAYIFGDVCTCHYAGVLQLMKDNQGRGHFFVQVSNSAPKGWQSNINYTWTDSYPGWGVVSDYKDGRITEDEYTAAYSKYTLHNKWALLLEGWKQIVKMADKKLIILLCWEGPGQFCHRNLLKKFLWEEKMIFAILNQDIIVDYDYYSTLDKDQRSLEWNQIVGYCTYTD